MIKLSKAAKDAHKFALMVCATILALTMVVVGIGWLSATHPIFAGYLLLSGLSVGFYCFLWFLVYDDGTGTY